MSRSVLEERIRHRRQLRSRRFLQLEGLEDRRLLAGIDRFDTAGTNDNFLTATDVGVAPGVHLGDLSLHSSSDEDWYRFELLRDDSLDINIRFAQADGDLALEIRNADNQAIAISDFQLDDELFELVGLSMGTYYVRVFSDTGAENEYSLEIEANAHSPTRVFYVNNNSTDDDFYSLAVGNDANSGLTPTEPKASVQSVLAQYDIGPADVILIDTGSYATGQVQILQEDEGAVYAGAPWLNDNATRTNFTYNSTRFELYDADANLFYNLGFSGSGTGIYARQSSVDSSNDNVIQRSHFNVSTAIRIDYGQGNLIADNVIQGGSYGVYLPYASAATIRNNRLEDVGRGIYARGTNSAPMDVAIENNSLHFAAGNGPAGIDVYDGTAMITGNSVSGYSIGVLSDDYPYNRPYSSQTTISAGNHIFENSIGIQALVQNTLVYGNEIYSNTSIGLNGYGTFGGNDWSEGQANNVYDNPVGIQSLGSGQAIRFNRVHNNESGILVYGADVSVHHNLVYRNTVAGIISDGATRPQIVSNTVYAPTGNGVHVSGSSEEVYLRNNILWSEGGYSLYVEPDSQQGFDSDYNNLFASGQGNPVWWQKSFSDIYDWQVEADYDVHSIGVTQFEPTLDNPRFVDLGANDFHLQDAVSSSIDAGDPNALSTLEPAPAGDRINLGAYGNTQQAAQSRPQYIELDSPDFYMDWEAVVRRPILWHSYQVGGRLSIELYKEGAGKVADLATVDVSRGAYDWSPAEAGIAGNINDRYRIRLVSLENAAIDDVSREAFSVPPDSPLFYVDDASNTNDQYTPTAVGSNRNTGKTPSDPKANLLPVLRAYDLGPGDSVMIDTGDYNHVRNTVISGELRLGNDEGVEITGPTDPAKIARLDRGNTNYGATNIEIDGADFTAIRHLTLVNGYDGLTVRNSSTYFDGTDLVAANNANDGFYIDYGATGTKVERLTAEYNGNNGIYIVTPIRELRDSRANNNGNFGIHLENPGSALITNNRVFENYGGIAVQNYGVSNAAPTKIEHNQVFDNDWVGIQVYSNTEVFQNNIYGQGGPGVEIEGGSVLENIIHGNQTGIRSSVCATSIIQGNRIYDNDGEGVYATSSDQLLGNVIYSNAVGVLGTEDICYYYTVPFSGRLQNNLIYDNTEQAVAIRGGSGAQLINNTLHQSGNYLSDPSVGNVVDIGESSTSTTLRNNILWAQGGAAINVADDSQTYLQSDDNFFQTSDGGVVASWQAEPRETLLDWYYTAFTDSNSQQGDPLFVDPVGADGMLGYVDAGRDGRDDDFHLQSTAGSYHGGGLAPALNPLTDLPEALPGAYVVDAAQSLAIDRGRAGDSFANEPANNGGFVNQGAFGNTQQASKSPVNYVRVISPNGGEIWPLAQSFDIRWRTQNISDTFDIDLLQESSPGVFTPVQKIKDDYVMTSNEGRVPWIVSLPGGFSPGDNYRIQVTRNAAGTSDRGDANFTIYDMVTDYYVNDIYDAGIDETTAAGDNAGNTGLSADSPKSSVRAILETFDMEPGSRIIVDNGTYDLNVDLLIRAEDAGVTIVNRVGTALIDRRNNYNTVVDVQANDVTLDHLQITGGTVGVRITGERASLTDNTIFGNQSNGILSSGKQAQILANTVSGSSTGINVTGGKSLVDGNAITGNSTGINASNILPNAGDIITISDNRISGNSTGVQARQNVLVSQNEIFENVGTAVYLYSAEARDNTIYSNSYGIQTSSSYSGSVISGNTIYNHSSYAVQATTNALVSGNTIYSNGQGVYAYGSSPTYAFTGRVINNLIYDSASYGISMRAGVGAELSNNTIYQTADAASNAAAIYVYYRSQNYELLNNILSVQAGSALTIDADSQQSLRSDYNLFDIGGAGQLGRWQNVDFSGADALDQWWFETGQDQHSQTGDSGFVEMAGPDGILGYSQAAVGAPLIIDNEDAAGFEAAGAWSSVDIGYNGTYLEHDAGEDHATATWTFTGLTAGTYQVAATWPYYYGAYDALFNIYDGTPDPGNLASSFEAYQYYPANDFYDSATSTSWDNLSSVTITGDTLAVQLNQNQYGLVKADAVRLQRIEGNGGADDNFRLLAASPAIDAGDPQSSFNLEPSPNGGRINQGAYGNTAEATQSAAQVLQILSPNGLEKLQVGQTVGINVSSDGLPSGSTFDVELSTDNGASWTTLVSAQPLDAMGEGNYAWNVAAAPTTGNTALIRVTAATLTDLSDAAFLIAPASDQYFLSPTGSNYNSGTSPSDAMVNLAALVAAYDLGGGDVLNLAGGDYRLLRNVVIGPADTGGPGNPLIVRGTLNALPILNRQNKNETRRVLDLAGATDVTIEYVGVAGAETGIHVAVASNRVVLQDNVLTDNATGILLDATTHDALVQRNILRSNSTGVDSRGPDAQLRDNLLALNANMGIAVSGPNSQVLGNYAVGNSTGIYASGTQILVDGNRVDQNRSYGIQAFGASTTISNNEAVGQQTGTGIYVSDARVENNSVHGNRDGIYAQGSSQVVDNQVFDNAANAVQLRNSASAFDNRIYDNSTGILASGYSYSPYVGEIHHNLLYDNINQGIQVQGADGARVFSNTLAQEVGDAIVVNNQSRAVQVTDNILSVQDGVALTVSGNSQQGFQSDYNFFQVTVDGKFGKWQDVLFNGTDARPQWFFATGQDEHSRVGDPQFVAPTGADGILGYSKNSIGAPIIVDNTDSGFTSSGSWTTVNGGLNDTYLEHPAGSDGGTATWTFSGLATGTYQVAATWPGYYGAFDATFSMYDGGVAASNLLGFASVYQYYPPDDFNDAGVDWEKLGTVTITGGSLSVQLAQHSYSVVKADAVRLQRIEGNGGADDNFHLLSSSTAIDAGNPLSDLSNEPNPNGGRINQGRYGNTSQAAASLPQVLQVLSPNGYEKYEQGQDVPIQFTSSGLPGGSTVDLQVSTDNGGTWTSIATGITLDAGGKGSFTWTAGGPTSGNVALIRAISGSFSDTSDEPFLIANNGNSYFLNDGSTVGDVYTTVAGNNLSSGKSADQPMVSLAALLAAYDMDPGDTIFVDTGSYVALRDALLPLQDAGVTIRGPSIGVASIDRKNSLGDVVRITDATDVILQAITLTGAGSGLTAKNADNLTLDNVTVVNNAEGVNIDVDSDATHIRNSQVSANSSGVSVFGIDAIIEDNVVFDNNTGLEVAGARSIVRRNTVRNNQTGIQVGSYGLTGADRITVSANQVFDNAGTGINAFSNALIQDNFVYRHSGTGIYASVGGEITGNTVYENYDGIIAESDAVIIGNRVYGNQGWGIGVYDSGILTNNVVYSNSIGITGLGSIDDYYYAPFDGEISNNLVYASSDTAIWLYDAVDVQLFNNTLYMDVGEALRIDGASKDITLRNNIMSINAGFGIVVDQDFESGFDSNYNHFYRGPGNQAQIGFWGAGDPLADPQSTLTEWQTAANADLNSASGDPLFVNPAGADNVLGFTNDPVPYDGGVDDNFYLKKDSLAIDSGDQTGAPVQDIEGRPRVDDPGSSNTGTGSGITDKGIYEFRGDSTDVVPATVSTTTPALIDNQLTTYNSFLAIQVEFSEELNPIDANASAIYELRRSVNGVMGDGDDEIFKLTPTYLAGSTILSLEIDAPEGYLPADKYQFTIFSNDNLIIPGANLHDLEGMRVDGDKNGQQGGDYLRTFELLPLIIVTPTTPEPLITTEAGGTATFHVALAFAPTSDVTIDLHSSKPGEGLVSPTSLTFTPTDFGAKTVTLQGVNDFYDDGDIAYSIVTSPAVSADARFSGLDSADIRAINVDDDTAGITILPTADRETSESGDLATFTVVLNARPFSTVTLGLGSNNPHEGTTLPSNLLFTTDNWNVAQTVTVLGVNDSVDDGDQVYAVEVKPTLSSDPAFVGLLDPNFEDTAGTAGPRALINYTNLDDDTAGITVSPLAPRRVTTEAGGTDHYSVVLHTQPVRYIAMLQQSSDTTEGVVEQKQRVFFSPSDWDIAQVMTIRGVDDNILDGDQLYEIVTSALQSPDAKYNGMNPPNVPAINLDDETFTCGAPAVGTPLHVFRQCSGGIVNPASLTTTLVVSPTTFTLSGGETRLSFHVTGANGFDPAVVTIQDENATIITPYYQTADVPGGTDSLGLFVLTSPHTYSIKIAGQNATSGDFTLDMALLGDVDGNRTVDANDIRQIATWMRARTYDVTADADLDGHITAGFDYFQARYNMGDSYHSPVYVDPRASANGQHAVSLPPERLQAVVTLAIQGFADAGLRPAAIEHLRSVNVQIAALPHGALGLSGPDTIWIDRDAQGMGWFASYDPTHMPDASAGIDLLTVVSHELGHQLGLPDLHPSADAHDLMTGVLSTGVRRLPELFDRSVATDGYASQMPSIAPVSMLREYLDGVLVEFEPAFASGLAARLGNQLARQELAHNEFFAQLALPWRARGRNSPSTIEPSGQFLVDEVLDFEVDSLVAGHKPRSR